METLTDWLIAHKDYALFIVPVIAFSEACPGVGIFVSGVFLLGTCTFLYTEQIASLSQMLPLAFMGALVADHCGYYLGRWLGPSFHHTRFAQRRKSLLDKAEVMFRDYGGFAITLGRLMTAVRSIIPILTGVSGLSPVRYTAYDLLACTVWTTGLGLLVVGLDNILS
ncbi:MAG: DedA family protein [Pseudomonadales bacterium]|nr:DedA family protein [Pseudomonadales bacterium]